MFYVRYVQWVSISCDGTDGPSLGFFPTWCSFYLFFLVCIVDRGKKIYIYRVLMIRGMRMLIWRSHHYGSTIWPQDRSRFWSFDYLNAHKLRKERQNKKGKNSSMCRWRHTSLIQSFHAARLLTCGCQMYRDGLFWSRCQSWNIYKKKMYKKIIKKKKKFQDTLPTYQYTLPSPAPSPPPYSLQRVQQQDFIYLFIFYFYFFSPCGKSKFGEN